MQAARAMQRIGVKNIKIIEKRGCFGGVWSANKYEIVGIQTPLTYYQFAEYLYAEHRASGRAQYDAKLSDFAPTAVILDYINGFASKFNLDQHAQFDTKLESLSRTFDPVTGVHLGWDVATDRGTEHFEYVIMATGMYSEPFTVFPEIENIEAFRADGGITVHSSEFAADGEMFRGRKDLKCTVVGGGKVSSLLVHFEVRSTLTMYGDTVPRNLSIHYIQSRLLWMHDFV